MKKLIPIWILVGVIIIFFWKMFTLQGFPFLGDIKSFFYPLMTFYAEELNNLRLPLWTPYTHNGFPSFAELQVSALYPLNVFLFSIFPPYVSCNYSIIIHFLLAGIFTYLYTRKIGLPQIASLISAVTFMLSGFFISRLIHIGILTSGVWLPLILYLIEEYFRKGKANYALLISIAIALQLLAGHPQITLYSTLCVSLYFFFKTITQRREWKDNNKRILLSFLTLVMIGIIVIGLTAVQIIPTFELGSLSIRSKGVIDFFSGSIPPQNIITLIFPYFFGFNPPYPYKNSLSWGVTGCDVTFYAGIFPLILVLIAVFSKKNKYSIFFLLLSLLSFLLMLGKYTPLYSIFQHIPGFQFFRAPSRFSYLFTFAFAILAGFGMNFLIEAVKNGNQWVIRRILKTLYALMILILGGIVVGNLILHLNKEYILSIGKEYVKTHIYGKPFHPLTLDHYYERIELIYQAMLNSVDILNPAIYIPIIFLALSIVLIVLWQKQKLNISVFKVTALSIVIVDLFSFSIGYNRMTKISEMLSVPKTVEFLKKDESIYRIFSSFCVEWKEDRENPERGEKMQTNLLLPNLNMVYHISALDIQSPLSMKRYSDILHTISPEPTLCRYVDAFVKISPLLNHFNLLSLLNIKYILFTREINDKRLKKVFDDGEVKIFKNLEVLPRAFVVSKFKVIKDEEDILKELKSEEFEPEEYIILEEDPKITCGNPELIKNSNLKITKYLSQEVVIDANMSQDGFLVLSDTYYPGWKVFVDGKEDKIYQADYIIRAVYLKKGNHQVRFIYDPLSFKIGATISLITLIGVTTFFIVNWIIYIRRKSKVLSKEANG